MPHEKLRHDGESERPQLWNKDDVLQVVQGVTHVDVDVGHVVHPSPECSVNIMEPSGWSSSQDGRDSQGFQRFDVGVDNSWHSVVSEGRISRPHL